jgi:hypothetical protein
VNTAVKRWLRSVEAELLMLHALGAHADDNFECELSVRRLALMTGFSKRHTGRVLHQLRACPTIIALRGWGASTTNPRRQARREHEQKVWNTSSRNF